MPFDSVYQDLKHCFWRKPLNGDSYVPRTDFSKYTTNFAIFEIYQFVCTVDQLPVFCPIRDPIGPLGSLLG